MLRVEKREAKDQDRAAEAVEQTMVQESDGDRDYDLAIVGMAGRFPGARNIQTYWKNLVNEHVALTTFSDDELLEAGISPTMLADEDFVKAAPVLDDAARFDAEFFGYSPKEATLIDPQQRQLLEVAWLALEDAAYDPYRFDGRIGVFAGTAMNTYLLQSGLGDEFFENYLPTLLGSDKDFLATRVAFKLALNGPAVAVQTACSTSLVALHLACQSLLNQESDMAVVGASAVRCPLKTGHLFEVGSVFAKDGVCRPFDADATGTVFGSGACSVVLKRYADAIADRDHVWAVVKGSAINNDGDTKTDFTAPSISQQAEAISDALASADINARSVSYIEAHGTGTYLGDPIEVEALTRAFKLDTEDKGFCGIGSVKSNIGHLDAAAGLASLIKVAMSLKNKRIPATANFSSENPQIDFPNSPFHVVSETVDWQGDGNTPLRAGISSLGMGGTNAHVVLEEFTQATPIADSVSEPIILPFSAKSKESLSGIADAFESVLDAGGDFGLNDIAHTLREGRAQFDQRKILVAESLSEAREILSSRRPPEWCSVKAEVRDRSIVLMFPGQGSQYSGMAKGLYQTSAVFKSVLDKADEGFKTIHGLSLLDIIFEDVTAESKPLNETQFTQPALYAVEYAYAKLIESWGIEIDAYIGHSIGEYVAAALADVFSFEDGLNIVCERGRLMQRAERGSMLAVPLNSEALLARIPESLDLAVVNGESTCVVGGQDQDIANFAEMLNADGVDCTVLKTSHAFHSRSMESAANEFESFLKGMNFSRPKKAFISNVTGDYIAESAAVSPEYWASQLRSTVQFHKGLQTLMVNDSCLMLEAGPGTTLSTLANNHQDLGSSVAIPVGRHVKSQVKDNISALRSLGMIWTSGYSVDWTQSQPIDGRRVSLPGYCFGGADHWFKSKTDNKLINTSLKRAGIDHWFWSEGWMYEPITKVGTTANNILVTSESFDESVEVFQKTFVVETVITPDQIIDSHSSFNGQLDAHRLNRVTLLLGQITADSEAATLRSLVMLLEALSLVDNYRIALDIFTKGATTALGQRNGEASSAILPGALQVLGHEFPDVFTRVFDFDSLSKSTLVNSALSSIPFESDAVLFAHRDGRWWSRTPKRQNIPPVEVDQFENKRCIVIGGFGGVGKELARHLAPVCSSLVLTYRPSATVTDMNRIDVNADNVAVNRQKFVTELQSVCDDLTVIETDVTVNGGCKELGATIDKHVDNVDYIFHLAGVVDDSLATLKNEEGIGRVLAPKVEGTRRLARCLQKRPPGKLILFSSTAVWLGPLGQLDYAAANSYLFGASAELSDEGIPAVTVAWPGWQDTGMLKGLDLSKNLAVTSNTISVADGLDVLGRVVGMPAGASITISPCNLDNLIELEGGIETQSADGVELNSNTESGLSPDQAIVSLWEEALGVDNLLDDDNFLDLGGDSLTLTQLVSKLRKRHGLNIDLSQALNKPTLKEWKSMALASGTIESQVDNSVNQIQDRRIELTAVMGAERYIKRRGTGELEHWNLGSMLDCVADLDIDALKSAAIKLVNHHEMLRAGFKFDDNKKLTFFVNKKFESAPLEIVDAEEVADENLSQFIEDQAENFQRSLVPETGSLFKIVVFKCGDGRNDRVLLFTHHFISDGLSWAITLSDFQQLYRQIVEKQDILLPDETSRYPDWCAYLLDKSKGSAQQNRSQYWSGQNWQAIQPMIDESTCDRTTFTNAQAGDFKIEISNSETDLFFNNCKPHSPESVLRLALAKAICLWHGGQAVYMDTMSNGRVVNELVDVTRTVGYFISYTPVLISGNYSRPFDEKYMNALEESEAMLALGNEHDLLSFLSDDKAVERDMENVPRADVLFNYIGNLKKNLSTLVDSDYWSLSTESVGSIHNSDARRDQPLAVRIEVVDGILDITFVYNKLLHSDDQIEKLAILYKEHVLEVSGLNENASVLSSEG